MKKIFSILFALILLLTGMNISVTSHICCGKITAIELSMTHQIVTCDGKVCEEETINKKSCERLNCCKNQEVLLQVDNNYKISSFKLRVPIQKLFQTFYIPEIIGINKSLLFTTTKTSVLPPEDFHFCAVNLPDICKFLI